MRFQISLVYPISMLFKLKQMSRIARKPVFWVIDQVRHKLVCSTTVTDDGYMFELSVTAQLICGFVFAYAKIRLTHDMVQKQSVLYTLTQNDCIQIELAKVLSLNVSLFPNRSIIEANLQRIEAIKLT